MAQCFGNEEDFSGKGRQMPVVRHASQVVLNTLDYQLTPAVSSINIALRISETSLPHNLLSPRNTDSAGGGCWLCPSP
jgi:hypothetical protein